MGSLIGWFARNNVVANLLLAMVLAGGAIALTDLKKEILPEFSLDVITVSVDYRGAGPEEVEAAVCVRLEDSVHGIDGIKKVTSIASPGNGLMTLQIRAGYDLKRILEEVKASVDAIETFPEEVQKPIIREVTTRFQVINVAISGAVEMATLKRLGERVRDDLIALPDISQADLVNVPRYEISIEVSEEALRRWDLTLDEVAGAVRRSSVDVPGGSLNTAGGEVRLRTIGQASSREDYERVPVLTRSDGARIHLSDVAEVVDGFEERGVSAMLGGRPAVVVQVYRVGDENAVSVAEAVHDYVAATAPTMPDGIEVATWQDFSRMLKSRIDLLVDNALAGLALVFIVLALFLRLRLAFWLAIGIPVSFLGAIALMPLFDVSLNMMSLFSFILVLGIVVDDAIVVGENIHTWQQRTGEQTSAAIRGTTEVAVPVTFGVLTTMTAFAPMLFVPGVIGNITAVFPLIVVPTLFFSLVESNLILPCHLAHSAPRARGRGSGLFARGWNAVFEALPNALSWFIRQVYRPVLSACLEWRYLVIALALSCVLLTAGMIGSRHIKVVLFPPVESDNVVAFLTMPREASVDATAAGVAQIERTVTELRRELVAEFGQDQFRLVLSSIGEHPFRYVQSGPLAGQLQGEHLGEVNVELMPGETRSITSEEVARRLRRKVGPIPGAEELSITHDLVGGGKAIDLLLTSPDFDSLREAVEITKERLARYPGVIEVTDGDRGGRPEANLALTPEGEALGLTLESLGRQVRQGFYGEQTQRIQRRRDDIRVMVRYPREDRGSFRYLEQMQIRTPEGGSVPFSTVAVASMGRGPASITRVDRIRSINVQAEVDESITSGSEVLNSLESDFLPQLTKRYRGVSYFFQGDEADRAESIEGLSRGFAVAMFVMFAMLAIPLKSYVRPGIILSAVPFGMVGAIWGHWILGMEVSFLSMCGMVALAGVVVNDSLVMVKFIDNYVQEHGSLRDAVQIAGAARFRAILLTSFTTAAGVTPLILEKSLQAQFLIPMAVALASGVMFATFVTLILVPTQYLVVEDIRDGLRWLAGRKSRIGSPTSPHDSCE